MKKGIWLSLGAILLIGVIVFAIWYINEEGKMRADSKDAFIPYNSALVISVNQEARLSPEATQVFGKELKAFRERLLVKVTDTLRHQGYVKSYPYVVAMRVEGKKDLRFLYAMDNKDVLSRNEIAGFLNQTFASGTEQVRKYDKYRIYTLEQGKSTIYFAVCDGIVLVSDSELYIEDGLKQFDLEENKDEVKPRYQNLNKYFSAGAGINVFLNTSMFTDVLPLYLQVKQVFPHVDISHFFKWGALDGEVNQEGVCLNGFMNYTGLDRSYIRTFEKQQPESAGIDGVVPAHLISLGMLNLSDPAAYFAALDAYRYSTGKKDKIYNRKQQYLKMFGKGVEEEWQKLLQGEFAVAGLTFNEATRERDGLVIAALKSGSLGNILLEKMLGNYARFDNKSLQDYACAYSIDREKSFTYYRFPVDDLASVYWGYVFEGIKSKYILIEDNYLILASSESAVKNFVRDYVHGSFIRDAQWYRNLKTKLAGKYNLAYFARTPEVLPLFKEMATAKGREFLEARSGEKIAFPTFALQWSNEGGMLYNTLFLSSAAVEDEIRPHLLWQTKLDARVSMKPVPVTNHVTGARELFVQDEQNKIYLINDAGRILWKMPVDGPINSEVYQVDLFKNGKLQYLFSTTAKIYLIDRNGNAAGRFPLSFRTPCKKGITVFDYDNNRDYRIFAPCADREVYLYGLDGKEVEGWKPRKADKEIRTRVNHFRVEGKDYIVFADQYRLYILDRKGKERVRVASVFDVKEQAEIFLTRKGGQPCLVVAGAGGTVNLVGLNGTTESFVVEGLSDKYRMNMADINRDGVEDCVFTDRNNLVVTGLDGKLLLRKEVEAAELDYPYIYRFSGADIRIGVTDPVQRRMMLLKADGSMSKGFPLSGDSPFSIVFFGEDGFYLFAGAEEGSVIKYKVNHEK